MPFGEYIAIDRGISAQVVSWRRNSDQSLPARSKIVGAYVNSAFSKTEAVLNGYDEAIVLTIDGHVSEGSAENFFMVRNGKLVTPPITDDILEGITRSGLIQLAREEMGMETVIRSIDRSELYARRKPSCAAPARRCRRSSRSTIGRSATARSGRSRASLRSFTSTPCAASMPRIRNWLRRSTDPARSTGRPRAAAAARPAARYS